MSDGLDIPTFLRRIAVTEPWPEGCYDPVRCEQETLCMWRGCVHADISISAAASKYRDRRKAALADEERIRGEMWGMS